jgi:hypothetical protein
MLEVSDRLEEPSDLLKAEDDRKLSELLGAVEGHPGARDGPGIK